LGYSGSWHGVYGTSHSFQGVSGYSDSNAGVAGESGSFDGVFGVAHNLSAAGVSGHNPGGLAGYFDGNVIITGTMWAAAKPFLIDHPLDPENKTLAHVAVESPDMKTMYDGVVTTDANGDAVVELPVWFGALNRDFRYQLTVIGRFAQAIVASEIESNRFAIKTNLANVKVSWQVTGIRQDAWANAHRIAVEEDKPAAQRGTYLHPEAFGQPAEKGAAWARYHETLSRMATENQKVVAAKP
jgi:hypothetical protein